MSDARVGALIAALEAEEGFEGAAQVTVRAVAAALEEAIREEGWGQDATLLRGLVHLRPEFGYAGLLRLELEQPTRRTRHLSSRSAWRATHERGRGVWVAVQEGVFRSADGASWELPPRPVRAEAPFERTRQELDALDVTHLAGLPLRCPEGAVRGMLTLELRCPTLGLEPFGPWETQLKLLERLTRAAAVYLDRLPLGPAPARELEGPWPFAGPSSRRALAMLEDLIELEEPILLLGESGTGKSHLARWLHARWGSGPFVHAGLATLPPDLAMMRLFGSRRGAFTGAEHRHGCLREAHGGTLFLDEIARVPLEGQALLLRVLDEGRYTPLGGAGEEAVTLRVIAATNADLQEEVQRGRFAQDLLYRLSGAVTLEPLRRRPEEIAPFAEAFLRAQHEARAGSADAQLSQGAALRLAAQAWPDNLRGLEAVTKRAWLQACRRSAPAPGERPERLVVLEEDVVAALATWGQAATSELLSALEASARAWVTEAERRAAEGAPGLHLDDVRALRALTLLEALRRSDDPAEVAALLGFGEQVGRSSNHLRTFRRELEVLDALCARLEAPRVAAPGWMRRD